MSIGKYLIKKGIDRFYLFIGIIESLTAINGIALSGLYCKRAMTFFSYKFEYILNISKLRPLSLDIDYGMIALTQC